MVLNTVLVVSCSVTGVLVVVAAAFETGRTVVETAMLEVVTLAGQSVTDGAQEVTVTRVVV